MFLILYLAGYQFIHCLLYLLKLELILMNNSYNYNPVQKYQRAGRSKKAGIKILFAFHIPLQINCSVSNDIMQELNIKTEKTVWERINYLELLCFFIP